MLAASSLPIIKSSACFQIRTYLSFPTRVIGRDAQLGAGGGQKSSPKQVQESADGTQAIPKSLLMTRTAGFLYFSNSLFACD
jgi:hypothetical protein